MCCCLLYDSLGGNAEVFLDLVVITQGVNFNNILYEQLVLCKNGETDKRT